jgi:nucleoside-triphosphatase
MPRNNLVTGPPRVGKTTVLQRTIDRLPDLDVGGVCSPERRENGDRVGFDLVDLRTGDRERLASVDRMEGPSVGKYRVDVAAVDAFAGRALGRAREDCDLVAIDEIGPMQVHSDAFVRETRRALDADLPVLAAIEARPAGGFVDEVYGRGDVELFEVTVENREELPAVLVDRLPVRGD